MMENILKLKSAPVINAEKIINGYNIKSPLHLDLEEIANAEKIIVEDRKSVV